MKKLRLIILIQLIVTTQLFSQWFLSNSGLYTSYSTSWRIFPVNNSVAFVSYGTFMYSNIARTTDSGLNWTNLPYPDSPYTIIDVFAFNSTDIWVGLDNGKIYYTSDAGTNWQLKYYDLQVTNFINYLKFFDSNNGVAIGDAPSNSHPLAVLRTTDGGNTWVNVNSGNFMGSASGAIWARISFPSSSCGFIHISSNISPQRLYKTIDGGTTWSLIPQITSENVLVNFYNENIGITFKYSPSAWKNMFITYDGGNTWDTLTAPVVGFTYDAGFLKDNPSKIWMTTHSKLYFSSDYGNTWAEQKIINASLRARDIEFSDSTNGWLLCDYGKVYRTYTANQLTGVDFESINSPTNYSLYQNYPNPFNPETRIQYVLGSKQYVQLKIYDLLGREIANLVDEVKEAGTHHSEFRIPNSKLSSGVYFYRLTAGDFIDTKKMVVLK